ncbi:hypothetical protein IVG45_11955 [Methylomonas sp. LL1]|uniref:hypothetical protein n=1 Tax=Methylomonas sp. LL1 TaxID=2785785 RepID=UPI0018C37D60|nr:hypothetical protein [Methylomonas sp. LL1]QPK61602.1 hypothetical protein IVG45_11955 [Methylomonas sp. LL1]
MNDSNTLMNQYISETSIRRSTYVTIDGIVKYCITAPLLELPLDFKEWYKPTQSNTTQLYPM